MRKPTTSASFSDSEQAILEAALRNPDATNAAIADEVGARVAFVRDVRDEYEDEVELPEDATGTELRSSETSTDSELSSAQQAILTAARESPEATNAEIAKETGSRITLVRDTLAVHGADIEPSKSDQTDDAASTTAASSELSDVQKEILAVAEENPTATNAAIAAEVGARITLVRDTLDERESRFEFGHTEADSDSSNDGLETQIREMAVENPSLTNAEIAAETGARIPFVRDTVSDANLPGGVPTDTGGGLPDGVDASELNPTEQAILETAESNPELTNAQIASKIGTRVAIVRDTRAKYESGESEVIA